MENQTQTDCCTGCKCEQLTGTCLCGTDCKCGPTCNCAPPCGCNKKN